MGTGARWRRGIWLGLLLGACGSPAPEPDIDADVARDAGLVASDAASADAGPPDAGLADAGTRDGGATIDAGAVTNVPGRHDHALELEGSTREVIVYVPESARDARAPVVFMFHGTSGDGERFYNISRWRQKADAEGLIAVFPSSLTYCFREDENGDGDFGDPGERKVTTKWAAGNLGDPAVMPLCSESDIAALPAPARALVDHPLRDDVGFVRAILELLRSQYAVDERRIYASGFSNGAQMTARLALELSDRFAAIGIAAGGLALPASPAARPISIAFSVGELDEEVARIAGLEALPLDESVLSVPLIATAVEKLRTVQHLDEGYTFAQPVIAGTPTARFTFANGIAGAEAELEVLVIGGLGHQYPNGTNHPVTMPDVLWAFFTRHALP